MRALAASVLALCVLAGLCVSTQYVASALHHAPQLGPPWLRLADCRLYAPWAWLHWSALYEHRAPLVFRNATGITLLAAILGGVPVVFVALRRPSSAPSTAHGSSRWATTHEIRTAGLLREAGVVLCKTDDAAYRTTVDASGKARTTVARLGSLVRHDGPEHVFCFAPTRSGKGVGLVIPTLLSWTQSVLVYDIKKENWALTAGWRKQFSRCWRFEPTASDSVRFNPLLEVRKGLSEVKDTQNVADILVDPTGENDSNDHWQQTAHSLLCAAILHVLYAEADKTLAGVAALLSDPARGQKETLEYMLATRHLPSGPHPLIAQGAREMLNKSDNELSGVVSTAVPARAGPSTASQTSILNLLARDNDAVVDDRTDPSGQARSAPTPGRRSPVRSPASGGRAVWGGPPNDRPCPPSAAAGSPPPAGRSTGPRPPARARAQPSASCRRWP